MGSGSSKDATEEGPSSSSNGCSSRSIGWRCFGSACFGLPKVLSAGDKDEHDIGGSKKKSFIPRDEDLPDSEHPKFADTASANNSYRVSDGNQEIISHPISTADRNSITQNGTTMNPPIRLHSRFDFFPDGISFRFGRAASLGSSSVLSRNYPIPCAERDHGINRNDSTDRTSADQETVVDAISAQDVSMNNLATNLETRWPQRRLHESAEGTARFSRTRSVGRLRDRVLRRTSSLEGRLGSLLPDEEGSLGRRYLNSMTNISSDTDDEVVPTSSNPLYSISRNISSIYNNEPVGLPLMEPGFQETLENSSAFLERRRRIRSQVRALQRLGSRFENVSGHNRSCIFSGQHRTGRCACRTGNRSVNPDDDNTGTRASISRIVMLAEALFEVLDEIHQQAIVLASRPSLSSIGSVPAPKEVVDCMPVKTYKKLQKQESDDDATQCYICLVEYEDGDSMRILPCHHEFHQACVDKWLKEIHRVCPLCRGDVCILDSSQVDG